MAMASNLTIVDCLRAEWGFIQEHYQEVCKQEAFDKASTFQEDTLPMMEKVGTWLVNHTSLKEVRVLKTEEVDWTGRMRNQFFEMNVYLFHGLADKKALFTAVVESLKTADTSDIFLNRMANLDDIFTPFTNKVRIAEKWDGLGDYPGRLEPIGLSKNVFPQLVKA